MVNKFSDSVCCFHFKANAPAFRSPELKTDQFLFGVRLSVRLSDCPSDCTLLTFVTSFPELLGQF